MDKSDLKNKLSALEYHVTQQCGTEPPFQNAYWDNKAAGIYVDVVSGEALFSSTHKFDSGTGWPSFTQPISKDSISYKTDKSHGMQRTETRSSQADSHLGHVFYDGPGPDGKRYCINSAALKFIPLSEMQAKGYADYLYLFDNKNAAAETQLQTAILAGGCFWGMQDLLRKLEGVVASTVGYTGGDTLNPHYNTVKTGKTGHAEAIQIKFDPQQISYAELLLYFFRIHDPTTKNQQGNDIGTQYRSAIFYFDQKQKETAQQVIREIDEQKKWPAAIVTELVAATEFYPAEDYHQDYLEKNPGGYTCHWVRE